MSRGDLRVGQGGVELGQAQGEAFELLAQGVFHGGQEADDERGRRDAGAPRKAARERR